MSLQLTHALASVFAEVVAAHSQGEARGADAERVAAHLQAVGLDRMCRELEERHGVPPRHAVAAAFGVFDADGDGFISSAELAEALGCVENTLDELAVAELLAMADQDGDGLIGQQDFFELLMGERLQAASEASFAEEEDEDVQVLSPSPSPVAVVPVGDLHRACSRGDEVAVDAMLREGADLLARITLDGSGMSSHATGGLTPLHCACEGGHAAIVQMVLLAAPYSSVLLDARADRRLDRPRKSYSEAVGPAETPRELCARVGHENARRTMGEDIHRKWREALVVIDHFVEDERRKAEVMLGQGMSRLSDGDVEASLECARTGLLLDRQNVDLQGLRDMAAKVLEDEIVAAMDHGNAELALELAERRRGLAPELAIFTTLYRRAEALASRIHASNERVREVGASLIEYERAATTLVQKAHRKMEEARQSERKAQQEAIESASWQGVAEREEQKCARVQTMWQTRAIRKLRRSRVLLCLEGWISYTNRQKVGHKVTAIMAHKHSRRLSFIVWHGWTKFVRMVVVARSLDQVRCAQEAQANAQSTQREAERRESEAKQKQLHAEEHQRLAEEEAQHQQELRRAAAEAADLSELRYQEERSRRVSVEQAQQDTRNLWIAEKRSREAIQAELDELRAAHTQQLQAFAELEEAHTVLRRQSIASRYDAWSGRKVGVDPVGPSSLSALPKLNHTHTQQQQHQQRRRPKSRG